MYEPVVPRRRAVRRPRRKPEPEPLYRVVLDPSLPPIVGTARELDILADAVQDCVNLLADLSRDAAERNAASPTIEINFVKESLDDECERTC